jgi:hypothetical protein
MTSTKTSSVQDLINAYTYDCFNPLVKTIITQFRDKSFVQLATDFMNAKKYKSKNPTATNESRFNDLMITLTNTIKETNQLNSFIKDGFYDEFVLFLNSQYDVLQDTFTKGAYLKMIDVLNRIFNPKKAKDDDEDDENDDSPFDNLHKYIKTYSPLIGNLLTDFKLYHCKYNLDNIDFDDFFTKEIINLYKQNYIVFNLYYNNHALWCFQNSLELNSVNNQFNSLTVDEFLKYIDNDNYVMNSAHYTTLETVKRDYIGKSFDMLKTHLQMVPNLYFYQGDYKNNSDFNHLNDLQLRNTIQGFPNGFDDDVNKKCLTIFCFNGNEQNINLTSFWLTTQPLDNVLNKTDYDAFNWTNINTEIFVNSIMQTTVFGTSCLH